jgi:hypothetical protein
MSEVDLRSHKSSLILVTSGTSVISRILETLMTSVISRKSITFQISGTSKILGASSTNIISSGGKNNKDEKLWGIFKLESELVEIVMDFQSLPMGFVSSQKWTQWIKTFKETNLTYIKLLQFLHVWIWIII